MSDRSKRIEEAATKMAAIWDRATMEGNSRTIAKEMGHDNYRAMFDAWSALRAALSTPAPEGGDAYRRGEAWHAGHGAGYRQGVEDAARVADESANGYQSDALRVAAEAGRETEPAWDLHGRALAVWSVARHIRALAPPATEGAPATYQREMKCKACDRIVTEAKCQYCGEYQVSPAPSASGGDEARCPECRGESWKGHDKAWCPACGGRGHA